MTVAYEGHGVTVHIADALDVLAGMADASVDAVVTDPPYGIGFMGKAWDATFHLRHHRKAPFIPRCRCLAWRWWREHPDMDVCDLHRQRAQRLLRAAPLLLRTRDLPRLRVVDSTARLECHPHRQGDRCSR